MNNKNVSMIQFVSVNPNDLIRDVIFGVSKNMEKLHREKQA